MHHAAIFHPGTTIRSIKARVTLLAILACAGLVALGTLFQLHLLRADFASLLESQQQTTAIQIARQLDEKISSRLQDLEEAARSLPMADLTSHEALGRFLERQPHLLRGFDDILVVDRKGRVIADSPVRAGRVGLDLGGRPFIRSVQTTRRPVITTPTASSYNGDPILSMAVPVTDAQGEVGALLLGVLRLNRENFLGRLADSPLGRTGYFAVTTRGPAPVHVMHPDRKLILTPVDPTLLPTSLLTSTDEAPAFEGRDPRGNEALFAYRALETVDWWLVTVLPTAEAFGPLRDAQRRALGFGALLTVLAATLSAWGVRRTLAPLSDLQSALRRFREGDGDVGAVPVRRHDEIGDLAESFNQLIEERRARAAELEAANDASPVGVLRTNAQGRFVYLNRTLELILGVPTADLMREGWVDMIVPEDRAAARTLWCEALHSGLPFEHRHRIRRPDGSVRHLSVLASPILIEDRVGGYAGTVEDITAHALSERALLDSEQAMRTIADNVPALVAYLDVGQHFRFANRAYRDWMGVEPEQILGRTVREVHGDGPHRAIDPRFKQALAGERVEFEYEMQALGSMREMQISLIPERDDKGEVVGVHSLANDVTAKKAEQRRLLQLAQFDPLTGMLNRGGFEQSMVKALVEGRRRGSLTALMYLDLDGFKGVNDAHGHLVGDELLKSFASRLTGLLRHGDAVCRLGGDEFTLILEQLHHQQHGHGVAAKIVGAMQSPFEIDGLAVQVTVSIGLAFAPGMRPDTTQDGATRDGPGIDQRRDALIRLADGALYEAKRAGRNTYRVAEEEVPI